MEMSSFHNTIFIAGIPKSISVDKIINKFSSYLEFSNNKDKILVAVYPDKGYGFVSLDSRSSITNLIKESKSKKGIIIDNHRIRIEISKRKISQKKKRFSYCDSNKPDCLLHFNNSNMTNKCSIYDTDDEEESILLLPCL